MKKYPCISPRDFFHIAPLVVFLTMINSQLACSQVASPDLPLSEKQSAITLNSSRLEAVNIEQAISNLQDTKRATLIIKARNDHEGWKASELEFERYGRTYTTCNLNYIDELLRIIKDAKPNEIGDESGAVFWNLRAILRLKKQNGEDFQIEFGDSLGAGYVPVESQGVFFTADQNLLDRLVDWGEGGLIIFPIFWGKKKKSIDEIFEFLQFQNKQQCMSLVSLSPLTIEDALLCQTELFDSCNY